MNSLHPDLKRLMHWARQSLPAPPPMMPLGFAARVVACRPAASTDSTGFGVWQRVIWAWSWVAAAVILVGAAMLVTQLGSGPPFDVNAAYQVVSIQFVP
jgi:hypothetical protein